MKHEIAPFSKPIKKNITIPGSKSFSNRALIMASLANGESNLTGVSDCDDTRYLKQALKKLGIVFKKTDQKLTVYGNDGEFKKFKGRIDIGIAGTTSRFLTALLSLVPGETILDGVHSIRKRPITKLVNALKKLGTQITFLRKVGCLPLKIKGGNTKGGIVEMDGALSSQYFTALLLIAPSLANGLTIKVKGKQISKSYIDMTIASLADYGVKVKNQDYKQYIVDAKQSYKSGDYNIEGDATGATYFWAVAAITGSTIKLNNISPDSLQGDVKFVDALEQMGCKVVKNRKQKWIEVQGIKDLKNLKAININMENMPDAAQTLAVVASFAQGTTKITGLSTLKIKETDRLVALKTELAKMNITTKITNNSIEIHGGEPQGATIDTYNDHRMAMAFAIAGAKIPGMIINNPKVVSKSFPEFWGVFEDLK